MKTALTKLKDIALTEIYPNKDNFYEQTQIEEKANEILSAGLLEPLVVKREPKKGTGEYKLISGERRYRALKQLVDEGYEEFEKVSCKVSEFDTEEEETLALILANSHRSKSNKTLLEEEKQLKKLLTSMKEKGQKLNGQDLSTGKLRSYIAPLLNISETKVAQIETIENNLSEELKEELNNDNLSFSSAYNLATQDEETQKEAAEKIKAGEKLKAKDTKKKKKEENVTASIEGKNTNNEIDETTQRSLEALGLEEKSEGILARTKDGNSMFGAKVYYVSVGQTIYERLAGAKQFFFLTKTKTDITSEDEVNFCEFVDGKPTGSVIKAYDCTSQRGETGLKEGYVIIGLSPRRELAVENGLEDIDFINRPKKKRKNN